MNRYQRIAEHIFLERYRPGDMEVLFGREDLAAAAGQLGLARPKNLGDVVYALRYRTQLPESITATDPFGQEWTIRGAGQAAYAFRLGRIDRIMPNAALVTIEIPDATPEIVAARAMSDEQALLAKIRYNRLLDVFLGVSAYSLQNHLRPTVAGIGQIEIDELYIAVDADGRQFILPVQAKGGMDQLAAVQSEQDFLWCRAKFPDLICRPVLTQFGQQELIAMFEVTMDDGEMTLVQEKHYRLVPAAAITPEDLGRYQNTSRIR